MPSAADFLGTGQAAPAAAPAVPNQVGQADQVSKPDPGPPPASASSFLSDQTGQKDSAVKAWWDQTNPIPMVQALASTFDKDQLGYGPLKMALGMAKGYAKNTANDFQEGLGDVQKGDIGHGVSKMLLSPTPLVKAVRYEQQGNVPAAIGSVAGVGTNLFAPEIIGKGIGRFGNSTAESIASHSLGPTTDLAEKAKAVDSMLTNRIPVSAGGLDNLKQAMQDAHYNIRQELVSAGPNARIPTTNAINATKGLESEYNAKQYPESDVAKIGQARDRLTSSHPQGTMTPLEAQDAKEGFWEQARSGKKAEVFSPDRTALTDAQTHMGSALMQDLEQQFPELQGQNHRLGGMMALEPMIQRQIAKTPSKLTDFLKLGSATSAVATGHPAVAASVLAYHVLSKPGVQSRLALALHRASNGGMSMATSVAKVAGYVNQLQNQSQQPPDEQQP